MKRASPDRSMADLGPDTIRAGECWQLLENCTFGRIACAAASCSEIVPVNYALDGRTVVFRAVGTSLPCAPRAGDRIVFEADAHNGVRAWTVSVSGTVDVVTDPDEIDRCSLLPILHWTPPEKCTYYRITPAIVTGRNLARDPHR